jgi:hypothetical protein
MPYVYNKAIKVVIEVNVKVVETVKEKLKGIVIVKGLKGSDIIVSMF